ncbi:unnamed protein product [Symbiodinium sp. CCMP2456]|nr:unnamed protein product [Symbiodinium sp. CCMP2456]
MMQALVAILAVGVVRCQGQSCDEEPSGLAEFLSQCRQAAATAVSMAWTGVLVPQEDSLAACVAMSENFVGTALEGTDCDFCPKACAAALLLQGLATEPGDTAGCTQTLLLLIRAHAFVTDEPAWAIGADDAGSLAEIVFVRREHCAAIRRQELKQLVLPPATASWPRGTESGRFVANDQVAILVAATPNQIHAYQPFLNLWRCYSLRHGFAFILETDDTEVRPPHHRAPNWLRWFTAKKYLSYYKALLVVDPDQFVVPECWNVSIPAVLGAWAGGLYGSPDVATRDFGRPQTLNNGVVLIRSSSRGHFFLDLLLEKAAWMQNIEKDQGAFDETVLEVLGMEATARGEEGYTSECAQYVWPNAKGNHEIALYALCWWRTSERLAGPFGARRSRFFRFADPGLVDVNHVVGARGLSEPAVLHHFAGRSKDWAAIRASERPVTAVEFLEADESSIMSTDEQPSSGAWPGGRR